MSEVALPKVMMGKDDKETIQNLYNAYVKMKREMEFVLQNLDGMNIDNAYINSLEVGTDIKMGPNAVLSWGQVTEAPDFTTNSELYTILGYDYIITGKIYASQINGSVANLSESVNLGNVGVATDKFINFFDNGSSKVALQMLSGGDFYMNGMNNVTVQSMSQNLRLNGGSKSVVINSSGITVTGNTEFLYGYTTSLNGSVQLGYASKIGFFGATPILQKTASNLSTSATLSEVITKINGILGILGQDNYNLIYVY